VTPFCIKASKRSLATSKPPDMAMQPLSANSSAKEGVKVSQSEYCPTKKCRYVLRKSSSAMAFKALGGAASSTK
jgi:hypothetical protein